jgi:hypothetical protein
MADNFKFSQDYELIPLQKQKSYPISTTEWSLIKKKVGEIRDNTNRWHIIGSILLGTSLPTLISALIGDFQSEKSVWICWSAFFITGISGGLSFFFGKEQKEGQTKSKEDVVDFMSTIEERFQNSISGSKPDIVIHSAKYGTDGKFIDLTKKINELVSTNVLEIKASNDLGGDPIHGKNKTLEIDCTISGTRKILSALEGTTIKIE